MVTSAKRKRNVRGGLCSTCKNDPLCTFPREAGMPVMECLEFEGVEEVNEARRGEPAAHSRKPGHPRAHEPGLCPLCDKRTTCTFPKQPGGVWLCEEFE